ncbi:DNA gyrase inhibitor YacG [Pseudochrobactrum sp. XF203]|uniref:DNA gyrase inhibitor YacG n=1 Tax=Pseudochrobactrum sp. XF203 TaxID=2879116 RepID=UPI001CE3B3A2|nr:DNA gyrase inhibitor YacG [Pseudochrobactrum sp. XF203]UCA47349.1 DNA gyrase inhibitor YacG [Pseudochrobactrum sp. XF203]
MADKDKPAASYGNVTPLRPTRPCPECGKPSIRDSYPFCSPRCRSVDLNRWLSDAYVIPGKPVDDSDQENS